MYPRLIMIRISCVIRKQERPIMPVRRYGGMSRMTWKAMFGPLDVWFTKCVPWNHPLTDMIWRSCSKTSKEPSSPNGQLLAIQQSYGSLWIYASKRSPEIGQMQISCWVLLEKIVLWLRGLKLLIRNKMDYLKLLKYPPTWRNSTMRCQSLNMVIITLWLVIKTINKNIVIPLSSFRS